MAVQTWEEVVAGLQLSADEKKLFDSVIAKAPPLKEGWLRQDEFSRKQTALDDEKKKFQSKVEYGERMQAWADANGWEKMVEAKVIDENGNPLWETEKTRLEAELDAAKKAAVGGDMDPKELDKIVR